MKKKRGEWNFRNASSFSDKQEQIDRSEIKSLGRDELEDLVLELQKKVSNKMDIEDHNRVEEELSETDLRYRMLFDSIDEGFCIIEVLFDKAGKAADFRFLEVNPSFEHQTGLKNALGKRILELGPDLEEHWLETYGQIALSGKPVRFQSFTRVLNRWFDIYAFRFGKPEKKQVGVLFMNITERKLNEISLRESEERFRALVTATSNVLYRMNPEWSEMRQFKVMDFLTDTAKPDPNWLNEYIPEEDQPYVISAIRESIQSKSTFELEHRVKRADGTMGWILSRAVPLINTEGEIYEWFGTASDITDRKQLEDLKRQAEVLETSNRELEAFSYSITHDLRSPLQNIIGYCQFLIKNNPEKFDMATKSHLEIILNRAWYMNDMISDLMKFSNAAGEEVNRESMDLNDITWEVVNNLRREDPERNVNISIQQGINVHADSQLMMIVMTNLIGNAWKFTGKNKEAMIEVGSMEKDNKMVCFVRDNGIGLDMKLDEKIFLPFKRAHSDNDFTGTGIGLSIVERIIKRHGGKVWAEGELGKGATFYFTLD